MTSKPYQIQYYETLTELLTNPDKEVKTRVGDAKSRFSEKMKIDLRHEFPLMDIKQTSFKNIYVELLWFIAGNTNIKFLVDNKCFIWNDDAFRWYNEKYVPLGAPKLEKDVWLEKVKTNEKIYLDHSLSDEKHCYSKEEHKSLPDWFRLSPSLKLHTYGDLDIVYGRQWRAFGGKVDQLANVISKLKTDPDDRRMIITAHNPADIADGNVGLPSCHNYMQFYTQPIELNQRVQYAVANNLMTAELQELADKYVFYKFGKRKIEVTNEMLSSINLKLDEVGVPRRYISVLVNIRSNDFFLGNPYNIASYGLLVSMIGQCVNMIPLTLSCEMVDCHLYETHVQPANEWIKRFEELIADTKNNDLDRFYCDAKLKINPSIKEIDKFTLQDCSVENYESLGKIEAQLLT